LHLKTVRVSVKSALVVNAIEGPLGDYFSTLVVDQRDLKHLYFKLNWLKALADTDQGLINCLVFGVLIDKSEFASESSCVHLNRLEGRVEVGNLVMELWHKKISSAGSLVGFISSRWVVILQIEGKFVAMSIDGGVIELGSASITLSSICQSGF